MNHVKNLNSEKLPSWVGWIGHMQKPSSYLRQKPWSSLWGPVKMVETFFRSLGVVAFACNPLTGVLIFCGMLSGNLHVAVGGLMGGIMGILTSLLLRADNNLLCDGVTTFNSILVGAVNTAVLPLVLGVQLDAIYWLTLLVATAVTVFIDQGLNAMMSPSGLPGQSVPFNLVSAALFLGFKFRMDALADSNTEVSFDDLNITMRNSTEVLNLTEDVVSIDWTKYFHGTIVAAGQIYGVDTVQSSIFVWFGFLIYSPLLTTIMFIGSNIGSLIGMFFVHAYQEVFIGLWGYNSLLAAGGIIFFNVTPPVSIIAAIVNSICAAMFQVALTPIFSANMVPVFSFPFNIAINLILAISTRKESPLTFVTDRTFPELDIYLHTKKSNQIPVVDDESSIPLRR